MSKETEIGTLIVVILKARNLNDKHKFRKQDAFAKVSLNGTEKLTNVEVKGGQHPIWDEEFRFPVLKSTGKKFRTLEVSCWAKEPRSEDLLGTGSIDISETLQTGEFDDWVSMSLEGVTRGDVYLEMTYYANGPPPPAAALPARPPIANQSTNNTLSVSQASNLMRRPSKLSPADRLWRPSPENTQAPTNKYTTLPPVPGERPSSVANDPQPIPSFLRPGAVPSQPRPISDPSVPSSPSRSSHQFSNGSPGTSPGKSNPYLTGAAVRPTNAGSNQPYQRPSPTPAPAGQIQNPYLSSAPSAPYNSAQPRPPSAQPQYAQQHPGPSHTPSIQYNGSHTPIPQGRPSYTPAPAHGSVPVIWAPTQNGSQTDAQTLISGFAFPTPSMPSVPTIPGAYPPSPPTYVSHIGVPPYQHHHRRESDPREDPSLRTRYQTPLPLPPGAQSQSKPDSPAPPPAPSPPRQSSIPPLPASAPRQLSPSRPDDYRLAELRQAEEEAARRREQELKDLELALQLDKELNL